MLVKLLSQLSDFGLRTKLCKVVHKTKKNIKKQKYLNPINDIYIFHFVLLLFCVSLLIAAGLLTALGQETLP